MEPKPTVRKLPADSVPYGPEISRRGGYVYGGFDGEQLIVIAATTPEVRRLYNKALHRFYKGEKIACITMITKGDRRV